MLIRAFVVLLFVVTFVVFSPLLVLVFALLAGAFGALG